MPFLYFPVFLLFLLFLLLLLLLLFFQLTPVLVTCYSFSYDCDDDDGGGDGSGDGDTIFYQCFTRFNFKYSTFSREMVFKRLTRVHLNTHEYYDRLLICWSNVAVVVAAAIFFVCNEIYLLFAL